MVKFNGDLWAKKKGLKFEGQNWDRKMDLLKLKVRDKKVLDAGSGPGDIADILSPFSKEIYGLDISKFNVDRSQKRFIRPNLFFELGNVEEMPYSDSSFDLIYSCWVIEHLENPSIFLNECHRVLKDKGKLILWSPNLFSFTNIMTKLISNDFKIKFLSRFLNKETDDVSHYEVFMRANTVSDIDKITKNKFRRIFLERYDSPNYFKNNKFLTYFWFIRHKLSNNWLFDFIWPSFFVEYQKS